MSRRLTGAEEAELDAASRRIDRAQERLDQELAKREQLIADLVDHGARISDIADVLGVSRTTIYERLERARES